jgi:hypothetical protein
MRGAVGPSNLARMTDPPVSSAAPHGPAAGSGLHVVQHGCNNTMAVVLSDRLSATHRKCVAERGFAPQRRSLAAAVRTLGVLLVSMCTMLGVRPSGIVHRSATPRSVTANAARSPQSTPATRQRRQKDNALVVGLVGLLTETLRVFGVGRDRFEEVVARGPPVRRLRRNDVSGVMSRIRADFTQGYIVTGA